MLFSRENQGCLQACDHRKAISSNTGCKGFGPKAFGPRKTKREDDEVPAEISTCTGGGAEPNPKSTRQSLREETMKYIHAMLAVFCLLIVSGAIGAARADDRSEENEGVTLYTPADIGYWHVCRAVNVSDKTLGITFAVLDNFGHAFSCDSPTTCTRGPGGAPTSNPTPEFQVLKGRTATLLILHSFPPESSPDGYCAFAVSGTDNRDDVRVSLLTFEKSTIPGTTTPVLLTRIVEGH